MDEGRADDFPLAKDMPHMSSRTPGGGLHGGRSSLWRMYRASDHLSLRGASLHGCMMPASIRQAEKARKAQQQATLGGLMASCKVWRQGFADALCIAALRPFRSLLEPFTTHGMLGSRPKPLGMSHGTPRSGG